MKRYIALKKIVELGSFTKASEELGYTQSAISQMVASLEDELGMVLLTRSRNGVSLTPDGRRIYGDVESFVNDYRRVKERAAAIRGLNVGTVRIGTIASVSAHWLPRLMAEFNELHPGVTFTIHQGDYAVMNQWLHQGEVDFCLMNPSAVTNPSFTCEPVKDGAMLAIVPEGHPYAGLDAIPLEALCEEPFILLEEGGYYEPLEVFRSCGLKPDVRYTIHDDYAIMTMVEAGLGVSILAELVLGRTSYRICRRRTEPPVTRSLAVVYRKSTPLPEAAKRFIALLHEHEQDLP